MTTKNFEITGMTCNHCVMSVKKELEKLPVKVNNVEIGKAEVEYDESKVSDKEITAAIIEAGYNVNV